ncbi:ECF transporter S component [Collinsella sp. AGMB00827]|uniref:ECF transporter S component n=2 Tax=Collinsella ureilytica TaxID=2869515 RepID=A0ABS7MMT5_9ACTN|nr:ECF transporter S component [Collinsella urealyticum]
MVALLFSSRQDAAGIQLLVAISSLGLFFGGYEASRSSLRQIMPTVVLAALAAASRILFAPIPSFKPVSAIAIIAGATLGRRSGFMVGALAALTSNFFFGQGMWTPWQMYAWGLVGYMGGVAGAAGFFQDRHGQVRRWVLLVAGLCAGLLFGAIMNTYDILGFVRPITLEGALVRLGAALPFDVVHAASTSLFLIVLYEPWVKRIERIVRKFALGG